MENTITENKPGYKKTKLGWIPEDWFLFNLSTLVHIDKASLSSKIDPKLKINYISLSDISNGNITYNTYKFSDAPSRARRITQKGDVLLATVRPNLKNFAIIKDDNLIASTGFAVLSAKKANNNFIYHYLFSTLSERQFHNLTVGSNYPALNSSDIKTFKIVTPPETEQKAIANCLSTWDTAISNLDALIKAKQKLKKALIQQLLSGKKRLPGFEGEWKRTGAGNIFKSISIKNNPDAELLSVTQDRGVIPRKLLEGRVTMPSGGLDGFKLVEIGNFVISLRSFQGGLEYSEYKGLVSPAYTVLTEKKEIDLDFYRHYFKSYEFIQRLSKAVIGIRDGKQISYNDFCIVKIPDISKSEQTAIAHILNTADKEIELLTNQLAQFKLQKKGLMQQLLTGKKRLV